MMAFIESIAMCFWMHNAFSIHVIKMASLFKHWNSENESNGMQQMSLENNNCAWTLSFDNMWWASQQQAKLPHAICLLSCLGIMKAIARHSCVMHGINSEVTNKPKSFSSTADFASTIDEHEVLQCRKNIGLSLIEWTSQLHCPEHHIKMTCKPWDPQQIAQHLFSDNLSMWQNTPFFCDCLHGQDCWPIRSLHSVPVPHWTSFTREIFGTPLSRHRCLASRADDRLQQSSLFLVHWSLSTNTQISAAHRMHTSNTH